MSSVCSDEWGWDQNGYLDFVESSSIGLMRLSLEGEIVHINRAGQHLLGGPGEVLGSGLVSFVVESDQAVFHALFQRAITQQSHQRGQVRIRRYGRHPKAVVIELSASSSRTECHAMILEVVGDAESSPDFQEVQGNLESTLYALPDVVFETDLDGHIHHVISVKGEFPSLAERQRLVDLIAGSMSPQVAEACLAALRQANATGRSRGQQIKLQMDGEVKWFELSISRKTQIYADGPRFVVLARNISRRKRAEELLSYNQTLLHKLAALTPLAMWSASATGSCFHVNDGWMALAGRPKEAAFGDGWLDCIHADDRERVEELWRQAVAIGDIFVADFRLVFPDGRFRWVHCQGIPEISAQGELLAYVGVMMDITRCMDERDDLEALVRERTQQLLSLVIELTTTEERERQLLSHELHDGLAQRLAVARLKLSTLIPEQRCHSFPCGLIAEMNALINEANEVVRSLSLQLSPPMLHEFGLMSTFEWLADEMYRCYGLSVIVGGDNVPLTINQTILSQVFRATRELLINVGKHAGVDTAEVFVACDSQRMTVSVADSGAGFDPAIRTTASIKGGYGLFSVAQRIGFIGGDVQIDSSPGDGSLIVLSVPLEFHS